MTIPRDRQKELRKMALAVVWQVLDMATREIDFCSLDREEALVKDDEISFVVKIIDDKAQRAFDEYEDYKDRLVRSLKK